ncbi:hypothetical protein ISCGN_005832, partial [Ixodes scapularis]
CEAGDSEPGVHHPCHGAPAPPVPGAGGLGPLAGLGADHPPHLPPPHPARATPTSHG